MVHSALCPSRRTLAMAMAIPSSVTVSIGELTTGVASRTFRVNWLLRSTWRPARINARLHRWKGRRCGQRGVAGAQGGGALRVSVGSSHLMSGEINVSRQEDHIVVSEADALAKQPGRRQTCTCVQRSPLWPAGHSKHCVWGRLTISNVGVEGNHTRVPTQRRYSLLRGVLQSCMPSRGGRRFKLNPGGDSQGSATPRLDSQAAV